MYNVPARDSDKIARLYDRSEIETRYSAISDFSSERSEWTFFEKDAVTTVENRMKKFFEIAPALCQKAVEECLTLEQISGVTHLITVSCTGMSAPGLDIQLMQSLNLPLTIQRSSVNFMGCYAAIHALKQADTICRAHAQAKVLVVDIELCTLHFQDTYTMDNMAASLLFGDGAAAVLISNEEGIYEIQDFYSEIMIAGYNDMAWDISSSGFLMTLSSYVPAVIAGNIEPMLQNSLDAMKITKEDIKHWAIHPGGKKIISEIVKALNLEQKDVEVSCSVLNDHGNMSSVTILYVLERMHVQIQHPNETIYTVAFGPGLTIETMFLKSC